VQNSEFYGAQMDLHLTLPTTFHNSMVVLDGSVNLHTLISSGYPSHHSLMMETEECKTLDFCSGAMQLTAQE